MFSRKSDSAAKNTSIWIARTTTTSTTLQLWPTQVQWRMNNRVLKSVGVWKWPVTSEGGLRGRLERESLSIGGQRSTHTMKWALVLCPLQLPSGLVSFSNIPPSLYYTHTRKQTHVCWKTEAVISRDKSCSLTLRKPSKTCHQNTSFVLDSNSVAQLSCLLDFTQTHSPDGTNLIFFSLMSA